MIKNFITFYFSFSLGISSSFGLPQTTDSLWVLVRTAKDDTMKVDALNEIAYQISTINPDSTILLAGQALILAQKIIFPQGEATAFNTLGVGHEVKGNYDQALKYYSRGLESVKKMGHKQGIAIAYNNIGSVFQQQGNFKKAIEYYLKSINIKEEVLEQAIQLGNSNAINRGKQDIGYAYNNIGIIHSTEHNYTKAMENYLYGLKIMEEIGDSWGIAYLYTNIGEVHSALGNPDQALQDYLIALKGYEENKDKQGIARTFNNIGSVYHDQGKYKPALDYHLKSLSLKEEIGDKEGISNSYDNIGDVYSELGNQEDAIRFKNRALQLARHIGAKYIVMNAYKGLSQIYAFRKDYRLAYENHMQYVLIKDTIFNQESSKQITEMQTKYETEKKEAQIKLLNADKEKQAAVSAEQHKRLYIILGGSILLLIAASGFLNYYIRSNHKQKLANIELTRKNNTIHKQKNEIEEQKKIVEEKNRDIIDSIEYASRIQQAIIPDDAEMGRVLGKEFFVFHRQKDIIGGDFYYLTPLATPPPQNGGELKSPLGDLGAKGSGALLALADCTGHGVPGALLSMLGKDQLNELVIGKGITDPEILLKKLDEHVTLALNPQKKMEIQDGMDMSVIRLSETHLDYAGARRPVIVVRNNEVIALSPTFESIGGKAMRDKKEFTVAKIELNAGDMIYLFTDGYGDQMGGPSRSPQLGGWGGKKFKSQRLKDTLKEIASKSLNEQKEILQSTFENWKGSGEQTDDVTVIGIRI